MIEALARVVSASAMAGTRSSLTLLVLGLMARWTAADGAEAPLSSSNTVLGILLVLAIVEEAVEQDEDLQEIAAVFQYVVRAAGGALAVTSLHDDSVGLPLWLELVVGVLASLATHHMRTQVHDQLRGAGDGLLSPRTWLAWLEAGGVIGVCVAILLAPWIAVIFVVLASVAGVVGLQIGRAVDRRWNERACSACTKPARKEASRCPHCRADLEIVRWLAPAPR